MTDVPNKYDLPTDPAECRDAVLAPQIPCATHNVGVRAIDSQIYRICQELTKNQSSRLTAFTPDDIERINRYYDNLVRVVDQVSASIADYHFLLMYSLTDLASVVWDVENETVNNALSYLVSADYNMRLSQSARLNDGMISTDKQDLLDAIAKSKTFIDSFTAESNPILQSRT